MSLAAGLPGTAIAMILLWGGDFTPKVQWTLTLFILGLWWGVSMSLRDRVVYPLQTLSNLLAALREEDFSIRARGQRKDDPLGEVLLEMNALADTLREQRLGALEATSLLRTVMEEIPVAVFAFDPDRRLRLANRAGERLLARPVERLLGRTDEELGLARCLGVGGPTILPVTFPGGAGRWEVRSGHFRQGGIPLELLVMTDVSQSLRDEERQAWQRLIRVIGHEINNSLAPIKSIAGSLESILARELAGSDAKPMSDPDVINDMKRGLAVIAARSDSLSRFTTAYARLAKLPAPRLETVPVSALVRRIAGVETRLPVRIQDGPELIVRADPDQLEQLLINLLHNATDAALQTGGGVTIGWKREGRGFELWIDDEGAGLTNASNLFVPFFTTKPGGSGIGLVLSRQIAEAHGGTLTLENRVDRRGCRAYLRLPV